MDKAEETVTITVSKKQAVKMYDILEGFADAGPADEGWQSDELSTLVAVLKEQIHANHR